MLYNLRVSICFQGFQASNFSFSSCNPTLGRLKQSKPLICRAANRPDHLTGDEVMVCVCAAREYVCSAHCRVAALRCSLPPPCQVFTCRHASLHSWVWAGAVQLLWSPVFRNYRHQLWLPSNRKLQNQESSAETLIMINTDAGSKTKNAK